MSVKTISTYRREIASPTTRAGTPPARDSLASRAAVSAATVVMHPAEASTDNIPVCSIRCSRPKSGRGAVSAPGSSNSTFTSADAPTQEVVLTDYKTLCLLRATYHDGLSRNGRDTEASVLSMLSPDVECPGAANIGNFKYVDTSPAMGLANV